MDPVFYNGYCFLDMWNDGDLCIFAGSGNAELDFGLVKSVSKDKNRVMVTSLGHENVSEWLPDSQIFPLNKEEKITSLRAQHNDAIKVSFEFNHLEGYGIIICAFIEAIRYSLGNIFHTIKNELQTAKSECDQQNSQKRYIHLLAFDFQVQVGNH